MPGWLLHLLLRVTVIIGNTQSLAVWAWHHHVVHGQNVGCAREQLQPPAYYCMTCATNMIEERRHTDWIFLSHLPLPAINFSSICHLPQVKPSTPWCSKQTQYYIRGGGFRLWKEWNWVISCGSSRHITDKNELEELKIPRGHRAKHSELSFVKASPLGNWTDPLDFYCCHSLFFGVNIFFLLLWISYKWIYFRRMTSAKRILWWRLVKIINKYKGLPPTLPITKLTRKATCILTFNSTVGVQEGRPLFIWCYLYLVYLITLIYSTFYPRTSYTKMMLPHY